MTCSPAQIRHAVAEPDVGSASGHVCGNGNASAFAGAGDNGGFRVVLHGIEKFEGQAALRQESREIFARRDAAGAGEDGPPAAMQAFDFRRDRCPFFIGPRKKAIRPFLTNARAMRRNGDHGQTIDLPKLARRLSRRAGDPREVAEKPEKALKAQARERLARVGDFHPFLGFDGLE